MHTPSGPLAPCCYEVRWRPVASTSDSELIIFERRAIENNYCP
jgi:hypothetical protein